MNVYLNIWQKEWRFKTASKTYGEKKKIKIESFKDV